MGISFAKRALMVLSDRCLLRTTGPHRTRAERECAWVKEGLGGVGTLLYFQAQDH